MLSYLSVCTLVLYVVCYIELKTCYLLLSFLFVFANVNNSFLKSHATVLFVIVTEYYEIRTVVGPVSTKYLCTFFW